jgi:hypothetical protein
VLLLQSAVCEAGGSGGVPNESIFDMISNILRLSCGFIGYVMENGWFVPKDPLALGL